MTQHLTRDKDLHRTEHADSVFFAKGREEGGPEAGEEACRSGERGERGRELGDE